MEAITRPNGTIYRPRHLRTQMLGNEDDGPTSIVVFGTTDVAEAHNLAVLDVAAYNADWGDENGIWLVLDESPVGKWYARRLSHFDEDAPYYRYELDPEKGAFGLEFDLTETEDPPTHGDDEGAEGVMPPAMFELAPTSHDSSKRTDNQ